MKKRLMCTKTFYSAGRLPSDIEIGDIFEIKTEDKYGGMNVEHIGTYDFKYGNITESKWKGFEKKWFLDERCISYFTDFNKINRDIKISNILNGK